jgi:hypothetical protein
MKHTVNEEFFVEQFRVMGVGGFSREARQLIFAHLIACEEFDGEETEMDVVAVSQYYREDTATDIAIDYEVSIDDLTGEEIESAVKVFLMEHDAFIGTTEQGLVYAPL